MKLNKNIFTKYEGITIGNIDCHILFHLGPAIIFTYYATQSAAPTGALSIKFAIPTILFQYFHDAFGLGWGWCTRILYLHCEFIKISEMWIALLICLESWTIHLTLFWRLLSLGLSIQDLFLSSQKIREYRPRKIIQKINQLMPHKTTS